MRWIAFTLALLIAGTASAQNGQVMNLPETLYPVDTIDLGETSTAAAPLYNATFITQTPATTFTLAAGQVITCTVVFDNTGSLNWDAQQIELRSTDSTGTATVSSPLAYNWRSGTTTIAATDRLVLAQFGTPNASNSATLWWTTPGDDGMVGLATRFKLNVGADSNVVRSLFAIDTVTNMPSPLPPGTRQSKQIVGMTAGRTYFACIFTGDEARNMSGASNVTAIRTASVRDTFAFTIKAPATAGRYTLFLAPYHPGTNTYLSPPVTFTVTVTTTTARATKFDFDGDGKADRWERTSTGILRFDYARNGFGSWDSTFSGYGGTADKDAPGNYDGDLKWDFGLLAADGRYLMDYAADGFGRWNKTIAGFGTSTDRPCPADYDGDLCDDPAVYTTAGAYKIDHSSINGFSGADWTGTGYGGTNCVPVPGYYDAADRKADIAISVSDGRLLVDYAANGFGRYDLTTTGYTGTASTSYTVDYDGDGLTDYWTWTTAGSYRIDLTGNGMSSSFDLSLTGYGGSTDKRCPADYDGDGKGDIAYTTSTGTFFVDYAANGFGHLDPPNGTEPLSALQTTVVDDPADAHTFSFTVVNPGHDVSMTFTLPAPDRASVTIYDLQGRRIAEFPDDAYGPGTHSLTWRASQHQVPAGTYFVRFISTMNTATRKVVVLR